MLSSWNVVGSRIFRERRSPAERGSASSRQGFFLYDSTSYITTFSLDRRIVSIGRSPAFFVPDSLCHPKQARNHSPVESHHEWAYLRHQSQDRHQSIMVFFRDSDFTMSRKESKHICDRALYVGERGRFFPREGKNC